jgi:IS4 transposase
MKDNADFHVTKVLVDKTRKQKARGVLKEQLITVAVKVNGVVTERLKLRRILFKTDEGKVYAYVTNNFTLPATQIATIYKNRWMIELLFYGKK